MKPGRITRHIAAALLMLCASIAAADERQEIEALRGATLKLIQQMVQEGLITQERADALVREIEGGAPPGEKPRPPVRVPYLPEGARREMRDQLREEVMAQARAERWADPGRLPEWADRISIEGD